MPAAWGLYVPGMTFVGPAAGLDGDPGLSLGNLSYFRFDSQQINQRLSASCQVANRFLIPQHAAATPDACPVTCPLAVTVREVVINPHTLVIWFHPARARSQGSRGSQRMPSITKGSGANDTKQQVASG